MPRILDTFEAPGKLDNFQQMLRKLYEQLARVINGGISLGDGVNSVVDNIDGFWINTTTPGVANTNFTITHNLGRVPSGFICVKKTASVDIYDGTVAATATQITLRATVISVDVRLFIF